METSGTMVFVEKGESKGIKAVEKLVAFAVHELNGRFRKNCQ